MTILGHTGYGKTLAAAWQLSLRSWGRDTAYRLRKPWVIIDAKGDRLFKRLPVKEIGLNTVPREAGLYIVRPLPNELAKVNDWLWQVFEREKIGLFFDEGYYISGQDAFRAILTQGRSKKIPCIICSQRPVWLDRFVFSESDVFQVFWLIDARDRKTIQSFMPFDANNRLPPYHSMWYDVGRDQVIRLAPVPDEASIIRAFKQRAGTLARVI